MSHCRTLDLSMYLVLVVAFLSHVFAVLLQFPVTLNKYVPPVKTTSLYAECGCCDPNANSTTTYAPSSIDETTTITSTSTIYVTLYSRSHSITYTSGNWTSAQLVPRTVEFPTPHHSSTH